MEPVTLTVMISSFVAYLGSKIQNNEPISKFISDFSQATIDWIKPIFLKEDGSETDISLEFSKKPDSPIRRRALESAIEMKLEDEPEGKLFIEEIFQSLSKKDDGQKAIATVIASKNVNTGNVNTGGGDFILGDNNKI